MASPDRDVVPAAAPVAPPSPAEPPLAGPASSRAGRRVAVEHLNVAPEVQALPLATPGRRFWALAIDLALVAVVGAIVMPEHPSRGRRAADDDEGVAATATSPASAASVAAAAVSAALAARSAAAHPPAAGASGAASDDDDDDDDARRPGLAAAEAVLASQPPEVLARQVVRLERQLAEARHPAAWYERGWRWLRGLVTGYGSSMAYFTLVTAFWRGRTVGKRLLGLRVVEITGKPLTVALSFTRYGGYVAGLLTGGFGLAQVLWDRNRQGLQDKVAHTLVVDERRAR